MECPIRFEIKYENDLDMLPFKHVFREACIIILFRVSQFSKHGINTVILGEVTTHFDVEIDETGEGVIFRGMSSVESWVILGEHYHHVYECFKCVYYDEQ